MAKARKQRILVPSLRGIRRNAMQSSAHNTAESSLENRIDSSSEHTVQVSREEIVEALKKSLSICADTSIQPTEKIWLTGVKIRCDHDMARTEYGRFDTCRVLKPEQSNDRGHSTIAGKIGIPLILHLSTFGHTIPRYRNHLAAELCRGNAGRNGETSVWNVIRPEAENLGTVRVTRLDGHLLLTAHVEALCAWVSLLFAGHRDPSNPSFRVMTRKEYQSGVTKEDFEEFWQEWKRWKRRENLPSPYNMASTSDSQLTSIMDSQSPKVAFAGLGAMGFGMASHLVKSGFAVTGFDVYQPSLDRFAQQAKGALSAKTPREAAQDVEFFICMVATSVQATPLLFDQETGAVAGLRKNGTIIMCSTVAPAYIAEVHSQLQRMGRSDIRLIDSPVSGGAGRAADGTLSIFASGEKSHLANANAILQCMSSKLYEIPGGLGGGSKAKLIHQIFAGINIAVTNEAMGLAALAGLDTSDVRARISKGEGWSWMFENRTPKMLDPSLPPYSAVTIIAKDTGIITQTGREAKFPLPLLTTAEQLYLTAISAGWGPEDDCVIVRLYLPGQGNLVAKRAGSASGDSSTTITWETIQDLLVGVHLASITEAMSFCEHLGVDTDLMYDIVSNAAGSTKVFEKYFERIKHNGWKLRGIAEVERIRERLDHSLFEVTSEATIPGCWKDFRQRIRQPVDPSEYAKFVAHIMVE
ncbi:MAG: hypothetical protein Q9222_004150 [Ikaeria aurantiellina]